MTLDFTEPEGLAHVVSFDDSAPILTVCSKDTEIINIANDGCIFWHGREVETDEDFRAAMLELRDYIMGIKR